MYILGISCFYHDSAAAILKNGEIIAAAQEERFSRKKNDSSFPYRAIEYTIKQANILPGQIEIVSFYEKPNLKFNRILITWLLSAPKGVSYFVSSALKWLKRGFSRHFIKKKLTKIGFRDFRLTFPEHHLSHSASAFYPSPYKEAAIITIDGVGEWATTTIGYGKDNQITFHKEIYFPHSLGLLYSAFTYYCGFRINEGEYKLMGLSSYGDLSSLEFKNYYSKINNELITIYNDGSFILNMNYFDYLTHLRTCNERKWKELFGLPPRGNSLISQQYANLALAIQKTIEDAIMKLVKTAKQITGSDYLTIAGGVGLNCVINGKILESGIFKDIWIQPAAGDAGGALGAALATYHIFMHQKRQKNVNCMKGALLGPSFDEDDILALAKKYNISFNKYSETKINQIIANELVKGKIIGLFRGRMEYGPRALGNRSILGNPCLAETQKKMNLKIKYRESFRPFAPAVLYEDLQNYFKLNCPSPYMLLVAPVKKERRKKVPKMFKSIFQRLYYERSDIPAVTHVDFSARIQTVHKEINPRFWDTINEFKKKTGYGLVVNTSFNIKDEPIVCTPEDAYKCFIKTEMDLLIMENFIFTK